MDWRNRISGFYLHSDEERAQREISALNEHLQRLDELDPDEWHIARHMIRLKVRMKAIQALMLSSIAESDIADAENDIYMGLLLRDQSLVSRGREMLHDISTMLSEKE